MAVLSSAEFLLSGTQYSDWSQQFAVLSTCLQMEEKKDSFFKRRFYYLRERQMATERARESRSGVGRRGRSRLFAEWGSPPPKSWQLRTWGSILGSGIMIWGKGRHFSDWAIQVPQEKDLCISENHGYWLRPSPSKSCVLKRRGKKKLLLTVRCDS